MHLLPLRQARAEAERHSLYEAQREASHAATMEGLAQEVQAADTAASGAARLATEQLALERERAAAQVDAG